MDKKFGSSYGLKVCCTTISGSIGIKLTRNAGYVINVKCALYAYREP